MTTPSESEAVHAGAFGASVAMQKSRELLSSKMSGTASDNHSDVASRTPDGGMSATASTMPPPSWTARPALDGADIQGADDKFAKDKGAAEKEAADKAASAEVAGFKTQDGAGVAAESKSKGAGGNRPMDGSDPSVAGPSERLSPPNGALT